MSFADDVSGYQVSRPQCSVGLWRSAQDAETRAEFDAAVASVETTKAVWLAMRKRGYKHNDTTVRRHRRGDCNCPSVAM